MLLLPQILTATILCKVLSLSSGKKRKGEKNEENEGKKIKEEREIQEEKTL